MKILFTAAEIARMRLPGLPTTKSSILSRAAKEGWRYEEQYGIGGIRKAFEIPDHYLVSAHGDVAEKATRQKPGKYQVKRIGMEKETAGSVNASKLAAAAHVLEKWETDENIGMTPDGKGKMIAIFYKMLMDGADMEDLSGLLKEVTDIARKKAGK